MKIIEVTTNKQKHEFLKFAHKLYSDDKEWIAPLDQDIEGVFDETKNVKFLEGEAKRWLIIGDDNKTKGRIAAFFNKKTISQTGKRSGGIGFFECINDQSTANLLFDTAINWLKGKGLEAIEGPINFGEKDRFWGLMVSGFKNPSYMENYNPPYYQQLFENYGFAKLYEQSTSEITVENFNFERFNKISSRVLNNPAYSFEHYVDSKLEKYASDFVTIWNLAWANRPDFTPMTMDRVQNTLQALRPILREDLIWFAYANNEPAGFYINTIEVNQIFKHLKGKMNLLAKLKFLWYRNFGDINRTRGIVFGVIPKYQNLGLETGMIMKFYNAVIKYKKLKASELSWIGDFNPKMHSLFEALGAKNSKVHYTYYYNF